MGAYPDRWGGGLGVLFVSRCGGKPVALAAAGAGRAVRRRVADQRRNLLGRYGHSPKRPAGCRHAADGQRLQLDRSGRRDPWRRARLDLAVDYLGGDLGHRCAELRGSADPVPGARSTHDRRHAPAATAGAHLLHTALAARRASGISDVPRAEPGSVVLAMDSHTDQYPVDRRDVCRHRCALILVPTAARLGYYRPNAGDLRDIYDPSA